MEILIYSVDPIGSIGVGPVTAEVGSFIETNNYSNPYKLNEQMSWLPSPKPVTALPGTYKP